MSQASLMNMPERTGCGRWRGGRIGLLAVLLVCGSATSHAAEGDPLLLRAGEHVQKGRYAEAAEILQLLLDDEQLPQADRVQAALMSSRVAEETGKTAEGERLIAEALDLVADSSALWGRQAELQWKQGRTEAALNSVQKSLDLNSQDLRGRLVAAYLFAETGEIENAAEQFRWFVRYYNRRQPTDWQTLMIVAEGSAQYARWRSVSEIFKFIVNTICPDALKDNADCWQAPVTSGNLLLEKYNREQAVPEFQAALAINPQCAPALAGLARAAMYDFDVESANGFADRALAINPQLLEALLIKVDAAIYTGEEQAADELIRRALAINPVHQQTLSRRLVMELLDRELPAANAIAEAIAEARRSPGERPSDGADGEGVSAWKKTLREAFSRSTRPGVFLADAGELLESRRHYDAAEVFYAAAIELMPQLSSPRTALGMLYMQTGRVDEAQAILDEAFRADPFHVRVSNMRKVLGVLKEYETITTEHFVIRADRSERLLANEMAAYLEEIYPLLTERFAYEPPTRTQFEVYADAKGQPAHAWFSARMIGLPWIQTIGASTGMIVALASPNETERPYNWARVVRHEFSHVLTLQKTRFQIPHWYTEALAVTVELADPLSSPRGGLPAVNGSHGEHAPQPHHAPETMPDDWQQLLISRVPAGELFTLADINSGFERAKSQDDWHMAYCQAKLYADYITRRFGPDGLLRLLDAFAATRDPGVAIPATFHTTLDDFESGYREMLEETVERIKSGRRELPPPLDVAEAQARAAPDDAAAQSQYAYALLRRRRLRSAVEAAEQALKLDESDQVARAVAAAGALFSRDPEKALDLLEPALASETPHSLVLDLRGSMAARAGDLELAEKHFRQLVQRYPREVGFQENLLDVSDRLGRKDAELKPLLESLAAQDADNAAVRKRLARVAADRQEWQAVVRWAEEAIQIDVRDAAMHRLLAEHGQEAGRPRRAIASYRALVLLDAAKTADRVALARLLSEHEKSAEAKQILGEILAEDPTQEDARELLQRLDLRQ